MDFKDFNLIYKENRSEIKDKSNIKLKLIEAIGEKNVSTEDVDILAYTKDTSMIAYNWTIQGMIAGLPDFITWPETVEQISEILN